MARKRPISTRGKEDLTAYKLYTLTELEPVLGFTHVSLLNFVKTGRLPAKKLAGKWRVSAADIETFLQEGKSPNETKQ